MTRKEIIIEIGKLEDKLERLPHLQTEIDKQIRELGKKLEGKEARPNQLGIKVFTATPEELEKLVREYTTSEIAKIYGVSATLISRYKKKWGIRKGRVGA